jgi:hypothetical protein
MKSVVAIKKARQGYVKFNRNQVMYTLLIQGGFVDLFTSFKKASFFSLVYVVKRRRDESSIIAIYQKVW